MNEASFEISTIDKPLCFTYNGTRYMLLLDNGALRVVGE